MPRVRVGEFGCNLSKLGVCVCMCMCVRHTEIFVQLFSVNRTASCQSESLEGTQVSLGKSHTAALTRLHKRNLIALKRGKKHIWQSKQVCFKNCEKHR